jgi:hypothetical protein
MAAQVEFDDLMNTLESYIVTRDLPDSLPRLPPRSRLYNLEPVGIGSAFVESLSSYIYRLADAHFLRPRVLLNKEIMPTIYSNCGSVNNEYRIRKKSSFVTATMGVGKTARATVSALETLTSRNTLRFLTMLTWRKMFPSQLLIKPFRSWCPQCLNVWRSSKGTIYEPLLWSIAVVCVCPIHLCRLEYECPNCSATFPHLVYTPRAGHCSKCGRWLGKLLRENTSSEILTDDLRSAKAVGELLRMAPLVEGVVDNIVPNLISYCVSNLARGLKSLSLKVGLHDRTLSSWKSSIKRPELPGFLQLIGRLNLSIQDALSENYSRIELPTEHIARADNRSSRRVLEHKSDWSVEAQTLARALKEVPPPTLLEVATRLNPGTDIDSYIRQLRYYLGNLCSEIARRHSEYKKLSRLAYYENILNSFLGSDEYPPLSMNQVTEQISKNEQADVTVYLYTHFPDHCKKISERFSEYKAQEVVRNADAVREKVRRAIMSIRSEGKHPSRQNLKLYLNMKHLGRRYLEALDEVRKELGIVSRRGKGWHPIE